jgi:hypothetical protein
VRKTQQATTVKTGQTSASASTRTLRDDKESRRKHEASGRKWHMAKKNKRRRGHGSAARRKGRRKMLQK